MKTRRTIIIYIDLKLMKTFSISYILVKSNFRTFISAIHHITCPVSTPFCSLSLLRSIQLENFIVMNDIKRKTKQFCVQWRGNNGLFVDISNGYAHHRFELAIKIMLFFTNFHKNIFPNILFISPNIYVNLIYLDVCIYSVCQLNRLRNHFMGLQKTTHKHQ